MSAAETARSEAGRWVGLAGFAQAVRTADPDPVPREVDVTGFDPGEDLTRRARRWGHRFSSFDFEALAGFAAGLAVAEGDAWDDDDPTVATRAFEERRFLFSDRIVHWAVPWADAAGRCHPQVREPAHALRDGLLELGDRMRPAPLLTGGEGLYPPGEDAFGPLDDGSAIETVLGSLHSGVVIFGATARSLFGQEHERWFRQDEVALLRNDLRTLFENAAGRWRTLAEEHPGTARLWRDLAERAVRTATRLST